jgi:hypothetical protein
MVRHIKYILIGIIVLVSCKPNKSGIPLTTSTSEINEEVNISSIGVLLSPEARKLTEDWLKYQHVKSKIENYSKVTRSEALQNAKELSDLVIDVSDTIDIKMLNRSDIKIRFNVLKNHVLRLNDMSTIPTITDAEVEYEVSKVLSAFSSINDKINTLIKIDGFDIKSEESEFVKKEIETTGTEYSSKPSWSISSAKTFEEKKRPIKRLVSEGKEPIKKEVLEIKKFNKKEFLKKRSRKEKD